MEKFEKSTYERFKNYDEWFKLSSNGFQLPRQLQNEFKKIKGKILDIGTGDGIKLKCLIERYDLKGKITAIEPSPLCKIAKQNLTPFEVTVHKIAFEDFKTNDLFDAILLLEVIEHVSDQSSIIEKVLSLLKPDGIFVCSTPNKYVYLITESILRRKKDETHISLLTYKAFINLANSYFSSVKILGVPPIMRFGHVSSTLYKFFPLFLSKNIYFFGRNKK